MATVRIHFPGNETATIVNLTGSRITVGRLPHNTIQIIDRTISALHAEFIYEGDHYRLHDRGSANGTLVNGESVTDFHLRDACHIGFGAFDCEFSPAISSSELQGVGETLPTRGEINDVRAENANLRNQVELLREELDAIGKATSHEFGAGDSVPKEEFVRVLGEIEKVKESLLQSGNDVKRLRSELDILQRDRANLQRGLNDAKAELQLHRTKLVDARPLQSPAEEPSSVIEPPAAAEAAAEPIGESEEQRDAPASTPVAPLPPKQSTPPAFKSLPKPTIKLAKPYVPPGVQLAEQAAPEPSVAQPQPFAPAAKAQPGAGSGIRTFAKSNAPIAPSKPGLAHNRPMAAGGQPPQQPPAAGPKPFPRPSANGAAAGPKGTQKL